MFGESGRSSSRWRFCDLAFVAIRFLNLKSYFAFLAGGNYFIELAGCAPARRRDICDFQIAVAFDS